MGDPDRTRSEDAGQRPEQADLIRAHPFTSELPHDLIDELAGRARTIELATGDVLFEQDGPGDAAYLVVSGRLTAAVGGEPVGEVCRGEVVGEMALLTGEPRAATITARRPSVLVEVEADDFSSVLAAHPDVLRSVTGQLVSRLGSAIRGRPARPARIIGLAADDPELACATARRLATAVERQALSAVVTDIDTIGPDGQPLAALEREHDVVIALTSAGWIGAVGDACDRSVYVVDPDRARPSDHRGPLQVSDVVFAHAASTTRPRGTSAWLAAIPAEHHHHVRSGSAADVDRLARRLVGRERVLVLGGGGARGFAHLGCYRALVEADIEVDALVGVSAGALFATCIALDWSPDEAIERSTEVLVDARRLVDLTVPMVALSSGRRITDAIREAFGADLELEDLWRPMSCISADLTTLSARVHRRGPVWRALRATVAVPGVFPPLVEGDAVLVDGGVVDNLPIERARRLYPGATVIGSDVGRRNEPMTFDLPTDGIVPGWRSMWRRVARRHRTPSVVRLLYRLTALGGGGREAARADVHIEHELDGIGMFDFARARPAIDAGYEQTRRVLASADALVPGRT